MKASAANATSLSVPHWTDLLSGWQARHPRVWIRLGNLESRLLSERLQGLAIEKPIYIAGLARSGTTILLELLARHPLLATHRYRDFPPVLAPWFWNWFVDKAGAGDEPASERAHGDGIEVTSESPEAFEEVLWMAFFSGLHDPEQSALLTADTANEEFEAFYRDHIRKLLLLRGGRRYLSKANYNLTRLPYLHKLFPDAKFLLPFRDPVGHIASLMRQHERFLGEHQRDDRLRRHMSRSGHFEFGLDRRPVNSGDTGLAREIAALWQGGREVEGWAKYWANLYGSVVDTLDRDDALRRATMVVEYESLCDEPHGVIASVLDHCKLASDEVDLAAEAARTIRPPSYYQPGLSDEQIALIKAVTDSVSKRLDEFVPPAHRPHPPPNSAERRLTH
jgi:hypothetical protein